MASTDGIFVISALCWEIYKPVKLLNKEQFFRLCVLTNFVNLLVFQIILYIEEFPVVVGPIGGKICP